MDYENFKKECETNGLSGVTEQEYKDHSPENGWSLMTAMRRIRNERRGVGKPPVLTVLVGFPLGGREFLPSDNDIDKSWKQFIPVLVPKTGVITEVDVDGKYNGVHGVRSEIRYEETHKPSADGTREYVNRTIQEVIVEAKTPLTLDVLNAHLTDIDKIDEKMLKQPVIIRGKIAENWFTEKMFEDRKVCGDWPLSINGWPCLQFNLVAGRKNMVKIRLTPRSLSTPIIDVPDFVEIAKHGSIDEMAESFADTEVVVAGIVSRIDEGRSQDGRAFVQIMATGIWEVPTAPAQAKIDEPTPAKPAPKKETHLLTTTKPVAPAEVKEAMSKGAAELDVAMAKAEAAAATHKPEAEEELPSCAPTQTLPQPAELHPVSTPAPAPAKVEPPTSMAERMKLLKDGVAKAAKVLGGLDKVTVENAKQLNPEWNWGVSDPVIQIAINKMKGK